VSRARRSPTMAAGVPLLRHAERVALLEADLDAALSADGKVRASLRVAVNADSLATWLMPALARFAQALPAVQLDLVVEDQDHADERLRDGDVLAAVTSSATPVQGCNSHALGALRYVATASPAFVARWFAQGVDAAALAAAPCLVFNRKDALQSRWLQRITRRALAPPCHWLPSTQGFVDGALAGLGWGMNPLPLVQSHLKAGRLVELVPARHVDVPLHWQASRLALPALAALTDAVRAVAQVELRGSKVQGRR
jgi:LysR family transcriptional regulator, chromosome initiation inhibitor